MKKVLTVSLCVLFLGTGLHATIPFQSADPAQADAKQGKRLDINAATVDQLQTLPGIGPSIARRIVEFRDQHGPFEQIEDLLLVRGIGEKKFLQLRDKVRAGG